MVGIDDIVITGLGCVSPIGIGRQAFQQALLDGKCGIRCLYRIQDEPQTTFYGATVDDFSGKLYVTPRKALKVMSREVQLAYAAAHLAWQDSALADASVDPDRMGVIWGSEIIPGDEAELNGAIRASSSQGKMDFSAWGREFPKEIYPLWMLRNLPNMPACHVGIAVDARGPNNTIAQEEVSSLLALSEAALIMQSGRADVMIVGAVGGRVSPTRLAFRLHDFYDQHPYDPATAEGPRSDPFGPGRRGIVPAEGAGAIILERRRHAVARGAPILASFQGQASRCGQPKSKYGGSRIAISSAISGALRDAGVDVAELDHVCAQGYSEKLLDIEEGQAIREILGQVPVTAFSSYFGTAGAACGILELIASIVGMHSGKRLATLHHQSTDPECPVQVCATTVPVTQTRFLKISHTAFGQAAAAVIECEM